MRISDYKALYISEAEEILQSLEDGIIGLEGEEDKQAGVDELFRNAHNLKGISGAMGYDEVVEASHALENVLDRFKRERPDIKPYEADRLLHSVDLLRELVRRAVESSSERAGEDGLLEDIFGALSPIFGKPAGTAKEQGGGSEPDGEGRNEAGAAGSDSERIDDGGDGDLPREKNEADDRSRIGRPEVFGSGIKSTRVELERLDSLMDLVGELIIGRIRLNRLARELGSRPLIDELASCGRLISQIQREVMEARLVPVGQVFQRFKRLVRDVSKEMGKEVKLEIVGSEIGLDKVVLESMVDPLVHLIRNAVDHGVESPSEREAAGKPEQARITLSARRERNSVIISVSDDGRGIDFKKIHEGEIRDELGSSSSRSLTDDELCEILTAPGFSTSSKVDRLSGRGMGMNIVKNVVDSLGGAMRISSDYGSGTTVSLQLPINLSIIKALLFYVGKDVHAIPIEYVRETTRVERGLFKSIGGREVFQTKDGVIPIVKPMEIFGLSPEHEEERYHKLIVVDTEEVTIGLVINRILGQQDVVIKGLPEMIKGISGISGATILGSGKVAFIWDPRFLFEGRGTYESLQ